MRDLESRGVDAVRASLAHVAASDRLGHPVRPEQQSLYATRGTDSTTVSVTRADGERWLAWRAAQDAVWLRGGAIAATLAAVVALLAWLFPIH